jgi:Ser/Thr protein kinase RdoA (MazF antagonist)
MSKPDSTPPASHIARAVEHYDIGHVAGIQPLDGDHLNTPHVVSTTERRFFVKLLSPPLSALPAVEARHAFIEHVAAEAVPVPPLMRTRDGRTHTRVKQHVVEVYEFVEGREYRQGDVADAEAAGEALGRLHIAAVALGPRAPAAARGWLAPEGDLARLARFEEQIRTYAPAPEAFAPVEEVKTAVRQTSAALAAADLPTAMTHGDFLPENLVYGPVGGPLITDFDYCHVGPLILDLATALIGFAGHGPRFSGDLASALLRAYEGLRPLTDAEGETFWPAVQRVLIHLRLQAGSSPEAVAEALREAPLTDGS